MSATSEEKTRPEAHPEPTEADFILRRYKGQKPPAPDWFNKAIAAPAKEGRVDVQGASINWRQWGDPSKPGILLVHGNGAHAHWWDFIAPFFADDYFVVAPDFSGMGDSDWRTTYTRVAFCEEQVAVAEAAGLFDHETKPLIIAHSFGGLIALHTIMDETGNRFGGALIVDSRIDPPGTDGPRPPVRSRPNRVYPTVEAALERFRLAPLQPCDNHYAVDYIARHSLKATVDEDGKPGFVWKFDPSIFASMLDEWDDFQLTKINSDCPVIFMRGEKSLLADPAVAAHVQTLTTPPAHIITIPDAHHHVMLDQPLAFVSAVRSLLPVWPG
ncbi:MAG: alpha/beta hydrolase [Pseudomonadota bacterium]|nr:alpha/beta hydrolase [Pseudomonadota bacterium]